MGVIHYKKRTVWRRDLIVALVCLAGLIYRFGELSAQPVLGLPKTWTNGHQVQLTLSNCNGTNVEYVVQMSTNLTDWIPIATNPPFPNNSYAYVQFTNAYCFYRLAAIPYPARGIVCISNFDMRGNNCTADSFDSSNPIYSTEGQWVPSRREANAGIVAFSITNTLAVGYMSAFGYLFTEPGGSMPLVYNGSVGDCNWVSNSTAGIESGHWISNYSLTVPDVPTPNTTGWSNTLPAAINGTNYLMGGTNYHIVSLPNQIYVGGNTAVWVVANLVLPGITIASNAHLILYVGNFNESGSNYLTLSGSGNSTLNMPGYASNLQIYGLPSLKSVDFHGNQGWVGTLYAPEASFIAGGGGNNVQDTSGAIVAHDIHLNGHWNFHFDEALKQP